MTYAEAIQFLYGLRLFGAKFGLENTFKLAALAGNPQEKLRFIHVAGTNGKGSTCAMLEAIYRAGGWRVGLFTSPHLVSFRERIQVNRQLVSEKDVVRLVDELRPLVAAGVPPAVEPGVSPGGKSRHTARSTTIPADPGGKMPPATSGETPNATFFEFITVMALKFFAEQKCDIVIWETGLGGRLDATNIVTPLASAITNIALDHQQWLGDSVEKIAFEKAGIIKPGVPVMTTADDPQALAVIETVAKEKRAALTIVGRDAALRRPDSAAHYLALPGEHQRTNAALALATVQALQRHLPVAEKKIQAGLANVSWPGRLQLVQRPNGREILLDGAHNVAGARVLANALKLLLPLHAKRGEGWGEGHLENPASSPHPSPPLREAREKTSASAQPSLILGILDDKDWQPICEILAPLAGKILAVPVASERTADPQALVTESRRTNPEAETVACRSLEEALQKTDDDDFVILTGSLYLVGEALELLGLSPAAKSERQLNEWSAVESSKSRQD